MNAGEMMRLCLVRHGETEFNVDERMQGIRDIALTARGREEAGKLGDMLRDRNLIPARLISSPVKRAMDTAAKMDLGVPIVPNPAFRARSLGILEGLTKTDIRARFPGAMENLLEWDWVPPGADEALGHLYRRAHGEIERLVNEHPAMNLLMIVTHSGVLEALLRGWHRLAPTDPLPVPLKNSGVLIFKRERDSWHFESTVAAGENAGIDHS